MKRLIFSALLLIHGVGVALGCTNLIVGKGASADGSVMVTYSADSYGAYMDLYHYPAAVHKQGEMRKIYDWDTNKYLGEIPEAPVTYNVIGNINEWQVSIAETTFGGREELVDTTGVLDYGSLIYIALQRSRTAREAIKVMTTLAETYGYCSEGETFSICDPNEAWIMEMVGGGAGSKKAYWVALRIPDEAICAHANQSRIRTFNRKDKKNVMYSRAMIDFARKQGFFSGKDDDFSFRDAFAAPDFGGRRYCEARVWSLLRRFGEGDWDKYLPYVMGKAPLAECEEMPLWIVPTKKVLLRDCKMAMRDHYEGTALALDNDMGGGVWEMPYRPTPLSFKSADGKSYFNERPVSTQQTAFTFVSQLRSWLPRQVGGVIWFGNDDANMIAYVPIYCSVTEQPEPFHAPGVDAVTFSDKSAYWVCNWVSNMVYPRYSALFPDLQKVRDELDDRFEAHQSEMDAQAQEYMRQHSEDEDGGVHAAVDYFNAECSAMATDMLNAWKQLAIFLIVKHNDMAVKPETNGKFHLSPYGFGATVQRPGYPAKFRQRLIDSTADKFSVE